MINYNLESIPLLTDSSILYNIINFKESYNLPLALNKLSNK